MKPVSEWTSAWSGSQGRAVTNYNAGVQQTTADWAGNLLRQKGTMTTNWNAAVSSPNYDSAVQSVGNTGWKSATQAKSANYGVGFSAGASAYAAAAQKIGPAIQNVVSSLPARGDINQNIQRSAAFALGMHQYRGTLGAK